MVKPLYAVRRDPKLSRRDAEAIIIDFTEQPIQRPRDDATQKAHYSGKKKHHTLKTRYVVTREARIAAVSESHPGSHHDLANRREAAKLPKRGHIYADSAYQGYDKEHPPSTSLTRSRRAVPWMRARSNTTTASAACVSASSTGSDVASGSASSPRGTGTRGGRTTPRRASAPHW